MRSRFAFSLTCLVDPVRAAGDHGSAWSAEWWLVYLTAALALVTGLLFYATFRLARDARDTSKRQAEEVKESFAIARHAAEAAQRSAEVAEKALHVGERAYVGVDSVTLLGLTAESFWFKDDRRTVTASVAYRNFGRTPAINVSLNFDFYWTGAEPFDFPDRPSTIQLNPNTAKVGSVTKPIDPATLQRISQGEITLHVKGTLRYDDLFGHRTELGYHFADGSKYKPVVDGEMAMHPEGNYMRALPPGAAEFRDDAGEK